MFVGLVTAAPISSIFGIPTDVRTAEEAKKYNHHFKDIVVINGLNGRTSVSKTDVLIINNGDYDLTIDNGIDDVIINNGKGDASIDNGHGNLIINNGIISHLSAQQSTATQTAHVQLDTELEMLSSETQPFLTSQTHIYQVEHSPSRTEFEGSAFTTQSAESGHHSNTFKIPMPTQVEQSIIATSTVSITKLAQISIETEFLKSLPIETQSVVTAHKCRLRKRLNK